ncbi:MAG: glucose-6-phosphate isomerase [Caldisericaceae bacterium]
MIFDFYNALLERVGSNGIEYSEIEGYKERLEQIKKAISAKKVNDYFALTLPTVMKEQLSEIKSYAKFVQDGFDNFVVVGMGGSSLGNEMLHYAMKGIYYNDVKHNGLPKMYFLENIDPESTTRLLENLDLKRTMFNIITKSGGTSETIMNFLTIIRCLNDKGIDFKNNVVVTTDPQHGFLRRFAGEYGIKSFSIPQLVGGRFSVLSPVGLLSASVEGIDVEALLNGAALEAERIEKVDALSSSAFVFPLLQFLLQKNRKVNITSILSYSDGLSYFGRWYTQLLAESIGKESSRDGETINAGITPLPTKGATDQHSILQLFMEGPFDKLIVFLSVDKYNSTTNTGNVLNSDDETISYLQNKNYTDLIKTEFLTTRLALTSKGRPNVTFKLDSVNEEELGRLIYSFEYGVIVLGELLNINAINQPAVELGKRFTYALMGRKVFDKEKEEFFNLAKGNDKYVIKEAINEKN